MKMTLRDKVILIVLGIALLVFGVYKALFIPTASKITELNNKKSEVEALSADITPVLEQKDKLKLREKELIKKVNGIRNDDGSPTATNEEFLVFLGESATKNSVQVTGFNDLGIAEEDGVYKATFDFELRGNVFNINNVLNEINNLGIRTSYGSVSFRQNEDYAYLKRYFDDLTELPWYTEPEEKKEESDEDIEEQEDIKDPQIELPPEITVPETILPAPPSVVAPTPTTPEDKEEKPIQEDKTINDRLNSLLENTSAKGRTSVNGNKYKVVFLTNTVETPMVEPVPNAESDVFIPFYGIREMRLAVTVEIIMFSEPQVETSILNHKGAEENEVF